MWMMCSMLSICRKFPKTLNWGEVGGHATSRGRKTLVEAGHVTC